MPVVAAFLQDRHEKEGSDDGKIMKRWFSKCECGIVMPKTLISVQSTLSLD